MPAPERPELLTMAEVAAEFRCNPRTARRMAQNGQLPAVLVAGRWLVRREVVDALLTPGGAA